VKILFVGDIVGRPGRRAVAQLVPILRHQHNLDAVIANAENAAGGSGVTHEIVKELFEAGIDVLTTGDHVWDQKEVTDFIDDEPRLLRPLNYPAGVPGHGSVVVEKPGQPALAVLNLQGRTFMPDTENPFLMARDEVRSLRERARVILVDMHAEATSEKIAMARMLDGQVSAVVGTHTHVQTADEQVFPGGTAFLCDAGFTGPHESVLGRQIQPIIERFLTNTPRRFEVASDRVMLQGALITIDESTGRALAIKRVSETMAGGS
jgi:2',3'-cyclic-nucleotide 2'-phosphodiesterase